MEKASKLSDKCSIIIPAIDLNQDAKKCIKESLLQKKVNVTIYLITNKKVKNIFKSKKVICLNYGNITMSKKRNLAVKKSRDDFIAFIDSDAYPTKKWLFNGIKLLKKKAEVAVVTGPDLPFKNQKGWSYIISLAHKSILLSGSKIFRKNLKNESFCEQASSCNMIIRKSAYDYVGGMDEKIYIGEDKDLCDKINKFFKILYSPKVLIYHRVRDFLPFLLQRFAYGTCILDIIKNNKKFGLNNLQYFIPMFTVIFFLILPIVLLKNIFSSLFLLLFVILNSVILIESLKITFHPIKFIKIFFVIYINIISFGLGSLMCFLGINKIKKIYTRR